MIPFHNDEPDHQASPGNFGLDFFPKISAFARNRRVLSLGVIEVQKGFV
jgi:hypothetical protein